RDGLSVPFYTTAHLCAPRLVPPASARVAPRGFGVGHVAIGYRRLARTLRSPLRSVPHPLMPALIPAMILAMIPRGERPVVNVTDSCAVRGLQRAVAWRRLRCGPARCGSRL